MRRETAGVTESLLQAAKEEFLTYGFHDASMRRISAACGVIPSEPVCLLG